MINLTYEMKLFYKGPIHKNLCFNVFLMKICVFFEVENLSTFKIQWNKFHEALFLKQSFIVCGAFNYLPYMYFLHMFHYLAMVISCMVLVVKGILSHIKEYVRLFRWRFKKRERQDVTRGNGNTNVYYILFMNFCFL